MILIVRGIVWYGFYVFSFSLPLLTAALSNPGRASQPFLIEGAVAAGFIGFRPRSGVCADIAYYCRCPTVWRGFDATLSEYDGYRRPRFCVGPSILLIISGYPAACWLNSFSSCADIAIITACVRYSYYCCYLSFIWRKRLGIRYESGMCCMVHFALVVIFSGAGTYFHDWPLHIHFGNENCLGHLCGFGPRPDWLVQNLHPYSQLEPPLGVGRESSRTWRRAHVSPQAGKP